MKLHHTQLAEKNQITSYGEGFIEVNGVRYEGSLVVTPAEIASWSVQHFNELAEDNFTRILPLQPAVVLFGTGKTLRFPHPRLIQALTAAQIGVESMDIGAACRTFNILVAEDRQVVLLILHD
jgi:uncharacterized protein